MKINYFYLILLGNSIFFSCQNEKSANNIAPDVVSNKADTSILKKEVNQFMDSWHALASKSDTNYFNYLANDGVFIGTDKSENWKSDTFRAKYISYFQKEKSWDFKRINRNIYFSEDFKYAWFDEQLHTWMGVCQSSGVLHKVSSKNKWEIKHYQLSITCPNEITKDYIKLVKESELNKLKKKKTPS